MSANVLPDNRLTAIIRTALLQCEPSQGEAQKLAAVAHEAKALVEKEVAGLHEVVGVTFGGSFAKQTWLRGDADIDIFVKIKPSVSFERFEELGKSIGLQALGKHRPMLRFSDHPYVEAFVKKVRVNVVPCYDVERGKWQSAADRSPFHTEYITSKLDEQKRNHARLLKKFFKSAGIYGAEISTGGFSGYVSEVLALKYGSFEAVLQAGSDWQEHQVIAVDDNYDPDVLKGFQSALIIIDPVDSRRNLGTAVSSESVGKFVLASRAFLSKPSLDFFSPRARAVKGRGRHRSASPLYSSVLVVEFSHRKRSPDVIWGQLKRSMNAVRKQLEIAGFVVLRSSCVTDEKNSASLAFLLESLTLPRFTRRKGPSVFRKKDSSSFLASSKKKRPHIAWVDGEMRIATVADRKAIDAREFVKSLFRDRVENSGIPRELIAEPNTLRIYSGKEKKMTGVAKEVIDGIVSTEHFIFK